jgi:hypothetical protein
MILMKLKEQIIIQKLNFIPHNNFKTTKMSKIVNISIIMITDVKIKV